MNSPVWQIVGFAGVVGFAAAVVLSFIGNRLLASKRASNVHLGRMIIAAVGGPSSARIADEEIARRRIAR
jgi:hypothetical protein